MHVDHVIDELDGLRGLRQHHRQRLLAILRIAAGSFTKRQVAAARDRHQRVLQIMRDDRNKAFARVLLNPLLLRCGQLISKHCMAQRVSQAHAHEGDKAQIVVSKCVGVGTCQDDHALALVLDPQWHDQQRLDACRLEHRQGIKRASIADHDRDTVLKHL